MVCPSAWGITLFPRAELPSQQVSAFRNRDGEDVNQRLVGPKAPVSFPRKEVVVRPKTPWVLGRGWRSWPSTTPPAPALPGLAGLSWVRTLLRFCLVATLPLHGA